MMNLNIVFITVHLALLEFVFVLSLPQRRDRDQRLVTPSMGTHDVNMTSSRSTMANRARQQQKQKSISAAVVGKHQPPMRNKTGRVQVTTESSATVTVYSCDGQCDIHLCPMFNGTTDRCQQAAVVSDPCRCCNCNSQDITTQLPNLTNRPPVVNACERLRCPRNKVCLLNIQGLPMCRCPSVYHCKGAQKRLVCTEGNKTFNNRCLVTVEECITNRRLRILHKGPCQTGHTTDARTGGDTVSRKRHL